MPNWITPSGILATANKGEFFQYELECSGASSFSIIAGKLPYNLSLSGPLNNPSLPFPTIWGTISTNAKTNIYVFTIRAIDFVGNIADRTFSLDVPDIEPTYVFPNSNLGIFPDGSYMSTSVLPIVSTSFDSPYIQLIAGSLPSQIQLNPYTGNISGYISPVVLYDSSLNQPNAEYGAPDQLAILPTGINCAFQTT